MDIENTINELNEAASAGYVSPYLNLSDAERQQAKDEFIDHFGSTKWGASVTANDYCDVDAFHRGWDKELVEISNDTGIDLMNIFGPSTKQVRASSEYGTIVKAAEKRGYPKVYNDPVLGHLANFWSAKWGTKRPTKQEWEKVVKQANIDKNKSDAVAYWDKALKPLFEEAYLLVKQNLDPTHKQIVDRIEQATGKEIYVIKNAETWTLAFKEDGTVDPRATSSVSYTITVNVPEQTLKGNYRMIGDQNYTMRLPLDNHDNIVNYIKSLLSAGLFGIAALTKYNNELDGYLVEKARQASYDDVLKSLTCGDFVKKTRTSRNEFEDVRTAVLVTDFTTSVYLLDDSRKRIYDFAEDKEIEVANYATVNKATVLAIIVAEKHSSENKTHYSYNAGMLLDVGMDSPVNTDDKRVFNWSRGEAEDQNEILFEDKEAFFFQGMDTWVSTEDKD